MTNTDAGIVDQVKESFHPKNRIAAIVGLLLGAIPPALAFCFSHYGVNFETWRGWGAIALVIACLAYSFPKVYKWGKSAFRTSFLPRIEAAGFAFLIDGGMTLADHQVPILRVVSFVCLAVLIGISAIVTACSIALDQREARAAQKEARETKPGAVEPRDVLAIAKSIAIPMDNPISAQIAAERVTRPLRPRIVRAPASAPVGKVARAPRKPKPESAKKPRAAKAKAVSP